MSESRGLSSRLGPSPPVGPHGDQAKDAGLLDNVFKAVNMRILNFLEQVQPDLCGSSNQGISGVMTKLYAGYLVC